MNPAGVYVLRITHKRLARSCLLRSAAARLAPGTSFFWGDEGLCSWWAGLVQVGSEGLFKGLTVRLTDLLSWCEWLVGFTVDMDCCLYRRREGLEFCGSFDPSGISAVSMPLVGVLCHQVPSLSATVVELTVVLAGLVIEGCSRWWRFCFCCRWTLSAYSCSVGECWGCCRPRVVSGGAQAAWHLGG